MSHFSKNDEEGLSPSSKSRMCGSIPAWLAFIIAVILATTSPAQGDEHPFLVAHQIDIDRIYSKILGRQEPWYSQFQLAMAEADSVNEFPYLWIDDKIREYNWDEYKLKADLGGRRMASLTLAYLFSKDPVTGDKLRNHLLGWCNLQKLALVDQYFPNWNHSHPVATLAINIALAYDLNNSLLAVEDKAQITSWLAATIPFIRNRQEINIYWSNQKAWNNASLMLSGLLFGDDTLVHYVIDDPENLLNTPRLIDQMVQANGQVCDFWQGCYDIWHSLLTLNAFALVASAAHENSYGNIFETENKLPLAFEFYAPLFQTNDAASLGPGFNLGDPPLPYHLYFSGIYEITHKYLPQNEAITAVLTDVDFNIDTGRFCRLYRQGDTCFSCSRWIKFPLLLWGQEIGYSKVKARFYLQGFFADADTMHTQLRRRALLPNLAPYPQAPKYISALPVDAVDWVKVSLVRPDGIFAASVSALLRQDGVLMDLDGTVGVTMDIEPGEYYLELAHRNHLSIRSRSVRSLSPTSEGDWNLRDAAEIQTATAMVEVSPGLLAARCGDVNQNGFITSEDYTAWYQGYFAGEAGYHDSDLNGDGEVTMEDFTLWQTNARDGGSSHP